ncbi:class I SAM-dependent methyltransferase [Bacillus mobilis]|uniref:SAM-dependent methyltransferase n=2 Tax=Bacillus cereus group TaxID=86661 RepID=A0A1C4BWN0_BACCE|nr:MULTISPECIES: class I SAM-dependent methyltransferase [Bacillus cereus group]MCU5591460.1 methyltransferase domain-containing protein [Bacillus mobilis]MCU5738904.1 methyltransferase domain-containing protein [Bacillus mobilis]MCU9561900.1 methyltransferase domain-containing protein [Bacillus mobilis]OKA34563.1 SAM-dependent methyltransferase [Bacillus cereus]OKA38331.1 SAM-dependent methyltransferase [Bacillus cereus]
MFKKPIYSNYDIFADIYNKHWGHFAEHSYPAYHKFILQDAAPKSRILDLCCGTGHLTKKLLDHNFIVTGIDGSAQMIEHALYNAPDASFIVDDARSFKVDEPFHYVISAGDSLNHILQLDELKDTFHHVYLALYDGGTFVFDMNMEKGFLENWVASFHISSEEYVCTIDSTYDNKNKKAVMNFILFKHDINNTWTRSDFSFEEACYSNEEIISSLESVGFNNIQIHGTNRAFFICQK